MSINDENINTPFIVTHLLDLRAEHVGELIHISILCSVVPQVA